MNPLCQFHFQQHQFEFRQVEQHLELSINGQLVARVDAEQQQGGVQFSHATLGELLFHWAMDEQRFGYQLVHQEQVAVEEVLSRQPRKTGFGWGLLGLVFKLFKSAGALKAALAGTALAGWAWLFSLEFAIALIIALLIHEFGHVWAMKQSGMKVKGVYLIPFLGGVAVGDASKSRWQEFKIAMAGPWVGSLAGILAWLVWLVYPADFLALFVALSVLINLFNLLPIVPLDGGQAVKAMVFSKPHKLAFWLMLFISALMVALSFSAGLYLLVFFGVLGAVDIMASRRGNEYLRLVPLTNYGIGFCLVSYLLTIAVLVALSFVMASSGVAGANLPLVFISS